MDRNEVLKRVLEKTQYPDMTYHEYLKKLIIRYKPRHVLEVGVNHGSSMLAMSIAAIENDIPCAFYGIDCEGCEDALQAFREASIEVDFTRGFDHVLMQKYNVDFVHLDADHTTAGLFRELLICDKYIKPKVIVVHDDIDTRVWSAVRCFAQLDNYGLVEVNKNVHNHCTLLQWKH